MPVRARRSGGGGGGGGRVSSGRRSSRSGGKSSEPESQYVTAIPRGDGSGGHIYRQPLSDGEDAWYNTLPQDMRWTIALHHAKEKCPKNPKSERCQMFIELLPDLPPQELEEHGLPKLLHPEITLNDPPLRLPDPPPTRCQSFTRWLQTCCNRNSHYTTQWKCAPLEAFVEEHCSKDEQNLASMLSN